MQSVSNRGRYVKINRKNIKEGREHNFEKYNSSYVTNFNLEYDYGSIMHYSSMAFSKDGESPTIVPRVSFLIVLMFISFLSRKNYSSSLIFPQIGQR